PSAPDRRARRRDPATREDRRGPGERRPGAARSSRPSWWAVLDRSLPPEDRLSRGGDLVQAREGRVLRRGPDRRGIALRAFLDPLHRRRERVEGLARLGLGRLD